MGVIATPNTPQCIAPDNIRDSKDSSMTITEGDYKLADEGRGKCMVKVKADGEDKWRLSVKVANTMNTPVTRAGEGMSAGPVMGTKMMPVPALEQLEKEISSLLNNLTNMKMEGSDLIIEGDGRSEKFVVG